MPERRRIVPDTSVVLESLFPGTLVGKDLFNIGPRARTILNAVRAKTVIAFAPQQLIAEVLSGAYRICADRSAKYRGLTRERAYAAFNDFLSWPIEFTSSEDLASTALDLVNETHMSAPDSWFAACAMHRDAELWIPTTNQTESSRSCVPDTRTCSRLRGVRSSPDHERFTLARYPLEIVKVVTMFG